MTKTHVKTVSIAGKHGNAPLSKAQKAFNELIGQIEKKRAQLAAWDAAIALYRTRYASELVPLFEEILDLQARMVHVLDRAAGQKGLTKSERRKIEALITGLAETLVEARDDAQIKAIYNQYTQTDYDAEEAAKSAGMKSMFEDLLGLDMGEDLDSSSPEDVWTRAQEKMQARQAQHDADMQAWKERLPNRKKSAKQIAREARRQADEQRLSQSIRELYRKLVSAFHPDREPDPLERERKTALMQRANQAYEKNNLLQLLELQLELEHIDPAAVNNISAGRLKDYNRILQAQLAELEQQILSAEEEFREEYGISPYVAMSPAFMMRNLSAEIAATRRTIREIKKELLAAEDARNFRTWLRRVPVNRDEDFRDVPF
ncbi:MAG: molecular chaperone DnaJ [Betaproteobacteria bacterium]|nr:molecular chaperone DnaJ [Betaproteobacteria bacterium]